MRWDFFFSKLTSKKTGAGEFKTHNHQTCLLGSSGMVAHLVDLASLFLPKPQHPDLHKMHLEDQIRVGRDQFPRWNLPKSHVALQDLPRRARCHAFGNGTRLSKEAPQNSTEFRNPSPISTDFCFSEAPIAPRPIGQSGRHRHHRFFALGEFHQSHVPASYDLTSANQWRFAIAGM